MKIVLKLSGESLAGDNNQGIDFNKALEIAKSLKKVYDEKIRLLIVIGGGNFWRGRSNTYMTADTSDYIGMLGTEMNALVLYEALKQVNCNARVFTRFNIPCAELYDEVKVKEAIADNIVIDGGGIGLPAHSTDSGAAASARDINADLLLKMSKTDGLYNADPFKVKDALKINKITFNEVIEKKLEIMDLEAFMICKNANIPIRIFKMNNLLDIIDIAHGADLGSLITN